MMQEDKNRRILIVDDNVSIHSDFRKILADRTDSSALDRAEAEVLGQSVEAPAGSSGMTFDLDSAYQGQQAWAMVKAALESGNRYAMAFVDMRMPPGWDGVETIIKLWEADPDLQIVVCTAYSDYSWEQIIEKVGHVDRLLILKKPFDTVEVCQLACALTQKWQLAKQAHLKLNQLRAMVQEQTISLQAEVSKRRRSEEAMQISQARYALAAAGANDGIWDWDFSAGTVYYSTRWKSMLGLAEAEVSSSIDEWFNRIHPEDVERVKAELDQHLSGKTEYFHSEFRIRHKDQQYRWGLSRGMAVWDQQGKPLRAAGSHTDITDRKMAEEQMRHVALHDTLTGLANRALLMNRITYCIERSKRSNDFLFAVIFLDLDRFKVINDSLGHEVGDKILSGAADRLRIATRGVDTVSRAEHDHVARLGGDEFVVLLDCIRTSQDALRVCQRILDTLNEPYFINGQEVRSSVSLGVAVNDGTYDKPEEILRDADTALYTAKTSGRGTFRIFQTEMHESAMKRLWMENELRSAVTRHKLTLYYQPLISLKSGKIIEFEALVRWVHPERGMIDTAEFISVAEETGLIFQIGHWVLCEACRQLKRWHTQFPALDELCVAVNVSGKQFARRDISETVRQALQESGLEGRYLKLEITETSAMDNVVSAITELRALREIGVQCHLDDFGTGYSSLGYLHQMPIEALKIDRSFISAVGTDPMGASIVQAITALGHSLKMQVVAEGVETIEQLEKLNEFGCDIVQGYHFSRPLPPEEAVKFLQRQPEVLQRSLAA